MNPVGQIRVDLAVNPLACTTIIYEAALTQVRQVSRDVGLRGADNVGQFTGAKLAVFRQEQETTKARDIRQCGEESIRRYVHYAKYIADGMLLRLQLRHGILGGRFRGCRLSASTWRS